MKKLSMLSIALLLVVTLAACGSDDVVNDLNNVIDTDDTSELSQVEVTTSLDELFTSIKEDGINLDDPYEDYYSSDYVLLETGQDTYTITEGGTYVFSGTYNASIVVNTPEEDVDIVLSGTTIISSSGPAILVLDGDDITISAVPNTENVVADSNIHPLDGEEDYNAAIYSTVDLEFNGSGTLSVTGNYNNAIKSLDDIKIQDITLVINSVDDGIIGRDYLAVSNSTITVTSLGDALVSTNDENTEKGFVYIESGEFVLNADEDGIQAVNSIIIYDGNFEINSGDNGLQSENTLYIGGGNFTINSDGDGLNAVNDLTILSGTITVNALDDGLHSDNSITIEGGVVNVESSYEGIEGLEINIHGGTVTVVSTDDGINGTSGGGQIHGTGYVSTGGYLNITGGIIQVNSVGDGIDVNGYAEMSGGYVFVYGAETDMQSGLDIDQGMTVTGGLIVSLSSDGMIEDPITETSTQAAVIIADGNVYGEGDTFTVSDSSGTVLFELTALKQFEAIVFSSEDLTLNGSYTFDIDGDTYDVTLSSTITTIGTGGTSTGMMPPGPGRR